MCEGNLNNWRDGGATNLLDWRLPSEKTQGSLGSRAGLKTQFIRGSQKWKSANSQMRKINLSNFRVATSETARDINRRIVLNFLRKYQPVSRADLARYSGLQCSTVSLIIEELIAEHWVTEGALSDLPRGRKPRVLHFNTERKRIVGVDVRPTHTMIGVADLAGRFVSQEVITTLADPEVFIQTLCGRLRALLADQSYDYAGLGVSLPGRIDLRANRLAFAPNLGWRNVDFQTPLEEATGLPVTLECAPNACALAEIWFGRHAQDVQDMVALAVSEGCGAGIIMNSQLASGPTGMAGEYGHVSVDQNGLPCRCGNKGCWEVYASNRAAVRYYGESLAAEKGEQKGKGHAPAAEPDFETILRLAETGDRHADHALRTMAHHLGVGIAMITTALAPSLIVVVGEITRAWERVGPVIEETVSKRVQSHLPTRIVATDDMVHPRLRGAVAVVLHKHLGAPLLA